MVGISGLFGAPFSWRGAGRSRDRDSPSAQAAEKDF
jgi:hypothetical protein